ncbi:MAG: serine/threonine-protein kinase [Planctomycetota bacterium]
MDTRSVLTEKDVLILKLALERRLLDAQGYSQVREQLQQPGARVAQLLRGAGAPGRDVGILVELATPIGADTRAAIPARCDVENVLTAQALAKARLVSPEDLARAQQVVTQKAAREGAFFSIAEILVEEGRLDLLQGAALRRSAAGLIATCPRCFRHYLLRGRPQSHCRPCGTVITAGVGLSAIDAWRLESDVRSASGRYPLRPGTDRQALRPVAELDAALPPSEAPSDDSPLLSSDSDLRVADVEQSLVMADEDLAGSVQELSARFGPYEVVGEINRGANGVVYRARRPGELQVYALKVLIAGAKATPQQVARFQREGEIGRRLEHRAIAKVFDQGVHGGYRYLVMEFAEGETLEELAERRGLDAARAAEVLAAVADAVDYLHGEGVIHRDLKPENVILTPHGPKLIDFGLAKDQGATGAKLTQDSSTLGTPAFMPPEQVRGESDQVTPAADVYALGAILYTVLTGRVPFVGDNYMDLFRRIVQEPVTPPRELEPGIPAPLEAVVLQCLAKHAENRYPTAGALAADLRRFSAGQAVQASPPVLVQEGDEGGGGGGGAGRDDGALKALLVVVLLVALAVLAALAFLISRRH